jgi:hypothetical protein
MQALRISQQLETTLTVIVSVLCLAVLVIGLASMATAAPTPAGDVREVRLDTVVITGKPERQVARTEVPASVLPLIQ